MEQDTLPTLLTQEAAASEKKLSARQKASAVDRREAAAILKSAQALEADAHMLSAEAIRSNEDGFAKFPNDSNRTLQIWTHRQNRPLRCWSTPLIS